MNFRKDNRGFSLVELIIVVAIIGILSGGSVALLSSVKYANSEKVVRNISAALSKQQVQSMSKQDKSYLYIYQVDGSYYLSRSTADVSTFDASVMNKTDGQLLGGGCSIYSVSASGAPTLVTGANFIKVAYKRDGSFGMEGDGACHVISVVTPSVTNNIKLIYTSGKHVIQ